MPADLDPDAALMLRVKRGDATAFTGLVEKYKQPIINLCWRTLGDPTEAEDLAQNAFVQAYKSAARYEPTAKFSTWLFTITRNLAINQSRRRKRSPIRNVTELNLEGIDISGDPYQVATRATDNLEKQEEITRVLKALEGLPTDQKEVIVLGVFQDMSYAQMEEITGTKAVTLRSRMFHGLKKLASLVGRGGERR